jgi:hypothetical protein
VKVPRRRNSKRFSATCGPEERGGKRKTHYGAMDGTGLMSRVPWMAPSLAAEGKDARSQQGMRQDAEFLIGEAVWSTPPLCLGPGRAR